MLNEASYQPEVSVVCTTYNQAAYIRDAIEGFLSQVVSFPIEIIVHDDASSDGTTEIVKEYADQYPDLIRAVLQRENQYSQGVDVLDRMIRSEARGRYVAVCEGDDYWISPNKLQTQYDFMEENPAYSLCLHNAYVGNMLYDVAYLSEANEGDCDKSFEEIVLQGGGSTNPTASFFFRKEKLGPNFCGPVSDHFIMIGLAANGSVRWMSEPMSVYRHYAINSFSASTLSRGLDWPLLYMDRYIGALESAKEKLGSGREMAFDSRIMYQERCGQREYATALYLAGQCGLDSILRSQVGAKMALHAFMRRHFPKGASILVGRVFQLIKRSADGTLCANRLRDLSCWRGRD